jgi:protein SCO1/2
LRNKFAALALAAVLMAACSSPEPLPTYSAVPDFSLTERSGRPVSRSDLEGQVWIADFIFTRCAGPCPLLSAHLSTVQQAVADLAGVRLVSFSVDPENDTPAVLSEYAERFGADPERWWFLTGEKQAIYDLIFEGFRLAIDDGSLTPDGKPGPGIITHSTKFVLIDRAGIIRGYYSGEEPDVAKTMRPDVERLLAQSGD